MFVSSLLLEQCKKARVRISLPPEKHSGNEKGNLLDGRISFNWAQR